MDFVELILKEACFVDHDESMNEFCRKTWIFCLLIHYSRLKFNIAIWKFAIPKGKSLADDSICDQTW